MLQLISLAKNLFGLGKTMSSWAGELHKLSHHQKAKVAIYVEKIADTLARACDALANLADTPDDRKSRRAAERELALIAGYAETVVDALNGKLDGRKLAGVKKRLQGIDTDIRLDQPASNSAPSVAARLTKAEGYFRALADGLRT